MQQKDIKFGVWVAIAAAVMIATTPGIAHAGLEQMVGGANTLVLSLAKFLTVVASLVGGWFVISGVMTWKKSSNEHSQQVDFKSVVVPIITGIILVCFTGFLMLTSQTFGFANPTTIGNF